MIRIKAPIMGKQRPRFNSETRRAFTPGETKQVEHIIGSYYKVYRGKYYPSGELKVIITAYMGIPKSYENERVKRIFEGKEKPTKKPDVDNIAKLVLDALNKTAYKDDAQVVEFTCRKRYSLEPYEYYEIEVLPI